MPKLCRWLLSLASRRASTFGPSISELRFCLDDETGQSATVQSQVKPPSSQPSASVHAD